MSAFVDHLQILPMPHRGGKREPDGAHRPGGLGSRTVADRLEQKGWVARIEDMSYDKPIPERRLVEAYARGLSDGVASAWDRDRFPVLLLRSSYGALGPVDALGAGAGLAWIDARGAYGKPRLLGGASLDASALSLVTGRVERDRFAVRPAQLSGRRILLVGGGAAKAGERRALDGDGVRRIGSLEELPGAVTDADADGWYLHVDLGALDAAAAPAADEPGRGEFDPVELGRAIVATFLGRPLKAAGFARYDLNRDADGRTLATLVDLIDAAVKAAGGVPSPAAGEPAA